MNTASHKTVAEVLAATLLVALLIAVGDHLAGLTGWAAVAGPLLAGGGLLVVPLAMARWRKLQGDVLAVDPPLGRAALAAVVVSLVVLPPFALGYDLLQTQVLGHRRGEGAGLVSAGWQLQGTPAGGDGVLLSEVRGGLVVENRTPLSVTLVTQPPQVVRPGRRALLPWTSVAGTRAVGPTGGPVALSGGAARAPLPQPLAIQPGYGWLATLLLTQLAAVALPEELCFRGYVLGRLRAVWPPRRRLLWVPFGAAHVGSAVLFAAVHLVTVPAAHRLLVFFPALVFAWLAERTRSSIAAAVHHALCNVTLQLLQRLYG